MSRRYDEGSKMSDRFWVQPVGETVPRLATPADAAIMRGMHQRGDKQSDITAYFGTNTGRVNETLKERRFGGVEPAPMHTLPLSGPHVGSGIQITGIAEAFRREQRKITEEIGHLREEVGHVLRQLAAFGRVVGVLENPQTPRIGRRKPLKA